jgi:predicted helicase
MPTMLARENLGLAIGRQGQVIGSKTWDIVFCSRAMTEFNFYRRGGNNLFPLYLYPSKVKGYGPAGGWPTGKDDRRPNLTPDFVEAFADKLGLKFTPDGQGDLKKTFGPEDVFHYTYAVFHSPTYRSRYAEFLRIDFPRLPLTGDKALFARLVSLGGELVGLHLLERVPTPQTTYPAAGSNIIDKPHYKPPTAQAAGRVYVNDAQYFDNVPPNVWEFHVGGYQVCEKWLKDRKGRSLSFDDIEHYRKITEAVRETLRLMDDIDRAIPAWPLA